MNPFIEDARFVNRECPPNPIIIPTIMALLPPTTMIKIYRVNKVLIIYEHTYAKQNIEFEILISL